MKAWTDVPGSRRLLDLCGARPQGCSVWRSAQDQRGFNLTELVAVMAVLGIVTAATIPLFLSFMRTVQVNGAAQQVSTLLNQARQLAITNNTAYRVDFDAANNRLRFVRTSTNTTWLGPGTDGLGNFQLDSQTQLTNVTANPTFSSLGSASPSTITIQVAQGSLSRNVVVSTTGRVRQCTPGPGCP